ncbi:MAG: alkaline phosphatase [Acetanaerobacterium sp.]
MKKAVVACMLCLVLLIGALAGCGTTPPTPAPAGNPTPSDTVSTLPVEETKSPKYIFVFIGDGMSYVQMNATQVYLGNNTSGEVATRSLNFAQFPVSGVVTTYDSTSFCPDSASTATAISCGVKTHSGVLGFEADKTTKPESITEKLKKAGMKIGIVSTVTINHATPAAFYAHNPSRNEYYDIALQLADSGFDYFGGGTVNQPTGKEKDQEDIYGIIESKGYTVADTKEDIMALDASAGKVYAMTPVTQDSGAMPYAMDNAEGDLTLADFVSKGIDVLDNDNGFFMMCESGKIDWACHANDAMSTINDVIAFEESVQVAVDFANEHPDETLIIVTGDHETGGMTIGYAATGYNTAFNILGRQKISYVAFDTLIGEMKTANPSLALADVLPVIKENIGLIAPSDPDAQIEENANYVLTDFEYAKLETAFAESMRSSEERTQNDESALLYGTYDPLSVTLTHIINNKAGIGWTSYAHTGTPVAVYATGAGSELFGGSYDNTDIFKKLVEIAGV